MDTGPVQRFGVSMEAALLGRFDAYVRNHGYANRSAALRDLVRDRLVEEAWRNESGEVAGAAILLYDHRKSGLSDELTEIQHHHARLVVSTSHVHLDAANCLEVVILRGPAAEVREVAEQLRTVRGVHHGRVLVTAVGDDMP
ncbi:MAG: nickel-responsive transcriptional regulator NikR [Bacillota bacterium]|nr:nickel-responsive transcriptional regulator NikR [Bacillota bacterium]